MIVSGRLHTPASVLPLLLVVIIGCHSEQTDDEPTQPFAGVTCRVRVPRSPAIAVPWQPIADEWMARTGGVAEIGEYALDDAGPGRIEQVVAQLNDPDVSLVVFPITLSAELSARGLLGALPAESLSETELDWYDFATGMRDAICSPAGQPAIVPLSSPVMVCYYRRDLLAAAGRRPPDTWQEYRQLVETVASWAPGLHAVEPWGPESRVELYLARSIAHASAPGSYSLFLNIESGEPLIATPGFVRGLKLSLDAIAMMPREVLSYSSADCRRELLSGRAAIGIAYEEVAENPDGKPMERAVDVALGFCRLPGADQVYSNSIGQWKTTADRNANRPTLTAFTGYAVGLSPNPTPLQAAAAMNLLSAISLQDIAGTPRTARSLCRESQVASAPGWYGTELIGSEADEYAFAVMESLRSSQTRAVLPVIGRDELLDVLAAGLGDAIEYNADPQSVLTNVSQQWAELLSAPERAATRQSYRTSLGLGR